MKNSLAKIFVASAILILGSQIVLAYTSPGTATGFVTDFAGIISDQTQASLENSLKEFAASTTIEIAVVTVNSLDGDSIENYANGLFREWGIGKKQYNNGILFLVAPNDRATRIEVGYGLEGVMPDIQAGYIIDNIVLPKFRDGDYEGGMVQGVSAIKNVVQGERFDPVKSDSKNNFNISQSFETVFQFFILFLIFGLQGFIALLASSKSWWLGGIFGVIVGVIISLFLGLIYFGLISMIILGAIGLLFDYFLSKSYSKYVADGGDKSPWLWGRSHFGGGSGGSGSFGGFGGGSSGGGGASGRW